MKLIKTIRRMLVISVLTIFGTIAIENALGSDTNPPCVAPPSGLVSWWQGEGDASDIQGTNNGVLLSGTSFTNGKVGLAFNFGSSNAACVKIPYSPTLISSNFTMEAWVNPAVQVPNSINQYWVFGQSYGQVMVLRPGTTGLFVAFGISLNPYAFYWVQSTNEIPLNQFSYLAGSWDGTTLRLYINGVLSGQSTPGVTPVDSGYPFWIGGPNGAQYFNGLVDEVSIYNRALRAFEIASLYNARSSGKCYTPTPPTLTSQPADQTLFVGNMTTFTVTARGAPPLSYQWRLNGTNIVGATTATLTLTNVQLDQAGNYSVQVSNAYGSTNSADAVLTVTPPPPCVILPSGLVAWWRGENNTSDSIGTNDGISQGGLTYGQGKFGQGLLFNGGDAYVKVPANTNINVGTGDGLTIEAWINPTDVFWERPIVGWDTDTAWTFGVQFWMSLSTGWGGNGPGSLYANIIATDGWGHTIVSPGGLVIPNVYQHVALTYDRTSGMAVLYLNGVVVAQNNLGVFTPQTTYDLYIGRSASKWASPSYWIGSMDDVSLYNRALTTSEIATLYQAGSVGSGKCTVPTPPAITERPVNQTVYAGDTATFTVIAGGTPPLSYQWYFNTNTPLANATNMTLTLTNVQLSQAGSYSVLVTNGYGAVTSSNAVLTVVTVPPSIISQPANRTVFVGNTPTFTVKAIGIPPLSYQWICNGTNIDGATNSTLTLAHVQFEQAGIYLVQVSNPYGSTDSADAVLTVTLLPPPPSHSGTVTNGLVSWWRAEGDALDSVVTNNGTLLNGTGFTNGMDGMAFNFSATNECVEIPYSPTLISSNFTMEAWVNPAAQVPNSINEYCVFGQAYGQQLVLQPGTTGLLVTFGWRVSPFTFYWVQVQSTNEIPLNQFSHLAVSWNGTYLSLYINGALNNWSAPDVSPNDSRYPFWIGGPQGAQYFKGLVDEVSIYNRALSASEIAANYDFQSVESPTPVPLSILSQPTNQTVFEGSTAILAVKAIGTSPLSYQWSFNATYIDGATKPILTLTNVQLAQTGTYSVQVVSADDSADSVDAVLTVKPRLPSILNNPEDQFVAPGDTATFVVVAAGTPPLSYQWCFNGTAINGATAASLSLTNVQPSQMGIYSVWVTNAFGSILTPDAALIVITNLPSITQQPANQIVTVGAAATFVVVADVSVPLRYQWLFNGTNVIEGATNATLTLPNAQLEQEGNYSVRVSNAYGAIVSASVTLRFSPSITVQPFNQTAIVGYGVTFIAAATGDPPLSYQWQFNGVDIVDATNTELTLNNFQYANEGIYSVVVSNAYGVVTSSSANLRGFHSGQIVAWGDGGSGECDVPSDLTNVVAIAAAGQYSLALTADGTVVQWGQADADVPYTLTDVKAIAAGLNHSLALKRDGTVVAWGAGVNYNPDDYCDDCDPPEDPFVPDINDVPTGLSGVVAIAAGDNLSVALKANGNLVAWGQGDLGDTNVNSDELDDRVVAIAAGGYTSWALLRNGMMQGWGVCDAGGYGNTAAMAGGGENWSSFVLELNQDGTVVGECNNDNHQLDVPLDLTNAVAVAAGSAHSLAIRADGTVVAWGNNDYGQTNVPQGLTNVVAIAAGLYHSLALVRDGSFSSTQQEYDTNNPTVRITTPLSNATVTNGVLNVQGVASDNKRLDRVLVSQNGGPFRLVTGKAAWWTTVNLVPSYNQLVAKSVDWVGNESPLSVVNVLYAAPSTLSVSVNGNGSVTLPAGAPNLKVGKKYTVKAIPKPNNLFSNWLSVVDGVTNVVSTTASYPFVMPPNNLTLVANFCVNGFINSAGTYYGLFTNTISGVAQQSAGFITVTVKSSQTKPGSFTGKLSLDGQTHAFAGTFNLSGDGSASVNRSSVGKSTLQLNVHLPFDGSDTISGIVTNADEGWGAQLTGNQAVFSVPAKPAASYADSYTMVLPAPANQIPGGDGYATVTVANNGKITVAGQLGNAETLKTSATFISKNGDWPFYAPELIMGWLKINTDTAKHITGDLTWIKAGSSSGYYAGGFTNDVTVLGGKYKPNIDPMVNIPEGILVLRGGNLGTAYTNSFRLNAGNKFVVTNWPYGQLPGPLKTTKITPTVKTGLIKVQFKNPANTNITTTAKGVVLLDEAVGRGVFNGVTDETGSLLLQAE